MSESDKSGKPELTACPFCGGEAEVLPYTSKGIEIRCTKCHVKMQGKVLRYSVEWLKNKMIDMWNQRVKS